jgi:hypothetical protein
VIDDILNDYETRLNQVRSRRHHSSDLAHRVALAAAYVDARDRAAKRGNEQISAARDQHARDAQAWTAPPKDGDTQARRTATRLAGALTSGQAIADAYDTAERNHDTEMMRALAMRASEIGPLLGGPLMRQVVDKYATANPTAGAARDRVAARQNTSATSRSTAALHHAATYSVPTPREFSGLTDAQIEQIAHTQIPEAKD